MSTQDVKKVVTILKLLHDARNIDKKFNELPAIIANRSMFIDLQVYGGTTFICISYEEYKHGIALSYQDMYYEGFDSVKASSLIQRAINALVYQVEHNKEVVWVSQKTCYTQACMKLYKRATKVGVVR